MVIVLKLVNGDTVMGLLSLEDDFGVNIQDPFILEYRIDIKGYRSMVLHRYTPFAEESTILFKSESIVTMYTADDDLSEYYFYSLDHSVKFRDKAMSTDIQRASEYIQDLIDNNNKIADEQPTKKPVQEVLVPSNHISNTVH